MGQAQAVLRAAFYLKAFFRNMKEGGAKTVGLDPFLSQAELAIKRKLKGLRDSERAKEPKPKRPKGLLESMRALY